MSRMMSFRRILQGLAIGILLLIAGFCSWLYLEQSKFIYHPRPYPSSESIAQFNNLDTQIRYQTSQGRQTAFYFPPQNQSPPKHLWVMFNGNASVALLTWPVFIHNDANKEDGFLLIDYPGYGLCEGKPSPANIESSADGALLALQQRLGSPVPQLRVIGHSLGAAAALQFAAKHDVDRVILLAPFTSISDMGKLMFGLHLDFLIRHNFDNRARLAELAQRPSPPRVIIFHGANDEVIPIEMGRELATKYPQITSFHPLNGIGHDDILQQIPLILQVMNAE
jgi:pimeloyl-ACP methyl ester carboxylesterase